MPYTLHFAKPRFKFSSSHFTVFGEKKGERLHGHNYQVQVELQFQDVTPKTGLTMDFNDIKSAIEDLCSSLDEKFLVPEKCPYLSLNKKDSSLEILFHNKRYLLPVEDCNLLPLVNITTEQLCFWLAHQLKGRLNHSANNPTHILVRIDETYGQGASYSTSL